MKARKFSTLFLLVTFIVVTSAQNQPRKHWVYFTDKGEYTFNKPANGLTILKNQVSERAIERRKKVFQSDQMLHETDLPVADEYLSQLAAVGALPVVTSKWLNAVSVMLTPSQAREVETLTFVARVDEIARYFKRPFEERTATPPALARTNADPAFYGNSLSQITQIKVDALHDAGITGKGILIGMMDTGFNRVHESLQNMEVVAERDFIFGDDNTRNEAGQDVSSQDGHGTLTLSTIGGFFEGKLIGPAYGAAFALGKTEDNRGETAVEEDYWVAGIEWLDSVGVDVVSSSLGYNLFSDKSYSLADMDGETAVTSIAADIAVSKGIVVVTSAGNEGNNSWGIITSPADAKNVITVGAVSSVGVIAGFSSTGPTADGRIKPDVVAQGVSTYAASSGIFNGYGFTNGTSLSTPLVGGVAALMLSTQPGLTPAQVKEALITHADRANNPDNTYGYGLIDALEAITHFGPVFSNVPILEVAGTSYSLRTSILSSANTDVSQAKVFYAIGENAVYQEAALLPEETEGSNLYEAQLPIPPVGQKLYFYLSAQDSANKSTVYPARNKNSSFSVLSGETDIDLPMRNTRTVDPVVPESFRLRNNFPNPFNNRTSIVIDLREATVLTLKIYNSLGQKVKTLFNGSLNAASHTFRWDGTNDNNHVVSSGVYFYRVESPSLNATKRMLFIK